MKKLFWNLYCECRCLVSNYGQSKALSKFLLRAIEDENSTWEIIESYRGSPSRGNIVYDIFIDGVPIWISNFPYCFGEISTSTLGYLDAYPETLGSTLTRKLIRNFSIPFKKLPSPAVRFKLAKEIEKRLPLRRIRGNFYTTFEK